MNRFVILLLIALMFSIVSCNNQKAAVKKYYVLKAPEATAFVDRTFDRSIDEFCEVEKVNIFPAFESRKIANRSQSHEVTYYNSHEWAVRPGEILTNMLVDFMDKKGLFNRVATRYWEVSPLYKVETTIYQLEVVNSDNGLAAHLHLEFRLVFSDTQEVIVKHKINRTKPMEEKKINFFATSISDMFYSALDDFTKQIYQSFKEESTTKTES